VQVVAPLRSALPAPPLPERAGFRQRQGPLRSPGWPVSSLRCGPRQPPLRPWLCLHPQAYAKTEARAGLHNHI